MKSLNTYQIASYVLLVSILASCSTLYKRSSLYKDQISQIERLKEERDSLMMIRGDISDVIPKTPSVDTESEKNEVNPLALISLPFDSLMKLNDQVQLHQFKGQSMRIGYRKATFDVYTLPSGDSIRFFWKNNENDLISQIGTLAQMALEQGDSLIFATNAGMFHPSREPVGLFIEKGEKKSNLNTQSNQSGNFFLKPNGVFLLEKNGVARVVLTEDFKNYEANTWYATQSGPMAVINGKIHEKFNEPSKNLRIRSGVGVDLQGRVVFAISNEPVNFYTFGSLFKDVFYCPNALYLDGSISEMYLPEIKRDYSDHDFGPLIGVFTRKMEVLNVQDSTIIKSKE